MKDRIAIALEGANGTGKSSLIKGLKERYGDIFDTQETPTRKLIPKSEINNANTYNQLKILDNRRDFILKHNRFLQDRSMVLMWAYTKYFYEKGMSDLPDYLYKYIHDECKMIATSDLIDKIIYLDIEFDLVDDGYRDMNKIQQKELNDLIGETIRDWGIEYKVIKPHGSVQERVDFVSNCLDKEFFS